MVAKKSWSVGQIALLVVVVGAVAGLAVAVVLLLRPAPAGVPAAPVAEVATVAEVAAPTVDPHVGCADEAAPFLTDVQKLADEWDDANTLAGSTPRASLPPQIDKLQALRRQTKALEAPECAFLVKQRLIDSMDNTINGYIAFLAQKPDSDVSKLFDQASRSLADFFREVQALK